MPNLTRVSLCLVLLAALSRTQEATRFHGVELDLPAGWTTGNSGEVLLLKPQGWKEGEQTGEAFGMLFDEETKTLDGEDLDETIDGAAAEIVDGMKRQGAPVAGKVGALPARTYRYSVQTADNRTATLAIHVFAAKDGCAALFVLGFPDKLQTREKEIGTMLDSLRLEGQKPKRRAFGLGKKDGDKKDGERKDADKKEGDRDVTADGKDGKTDKTDKDVAAEKAEFRRIPGAKELVWNGIAIDVPKDWRIQTSDDGSQVLMPPGFGESGVLEEIYALCGDGSLKSLDARDTMPKLQAALDEVQPGLTPKGEATVAKFGAIPGKKYVFTGQSPDGQAVEARVYAFPTQRGVYALLALGFPRSLTNREKTLGQMLDSMRLAPAAAAGSVPAELAGQWVCYTGFNANNGGGSQRQKSLTLRADGTFSYTTEYVSTNPNGAAWGDQNDAGQWSADATTITFRSQNGGSRSFALVKRNHPKNRDPMLVIDGTEFVTATQRAPW